MDHFGELQQIVGKYTTQSNLLVAAGPLTAATIVKTFVGKSKLMKYAMIGGGAWFAVKELSGPALGLMQDQFGNLQGIFAGFNR